ncbi:MAG: YHS domain-containing (seleno)protein [Tepidamorphaceae bacterium]
MSAIRRNSGLSAIRTMAVAVVLIACGVRGVLAAGDGTGALPADAASSVPTPVSTDATTGFAISGFDPVAYFTENRARSGVANQEVRWNEAAWRFANAGNCDAFKQHPEIYAPRFGGFSVVSLARGQLVESDPEVFTIHKGKLYLFYSPQQATVFAEAPDDFVAKAEKTWRRINHLPDPPPQPQAVVADKKSEMKDQPGVDIFGLSGKPE